MSDARSSCAPPSREARASHRCVHAHFAPFGEDWFGRQAERFARFFGTPAFLIGQTAVVTGWIALNVAAASLRWDPYPFILLNLMFSLQAAYAAPLILLAQTRQADRDQALALSDAAHREAFDRTAASWREDAARHSEQLRAVLESNRELAHQVQRLNEELGAELERRGVRSETRRNDRRSGRPNADAGEGRSYPGTWGGGSSARPMSNDEPGRDPARR